MKRYTVEVLRGDRVSTRVVNATDHVISNGWIFFRRDTISAAAVPTARVLWIKIEDERPPEPVKEIHAE